jgi:hypothetical protein
MGMIYKHYKGKEYNLLYVGKHTETGEILAIYKPLEEDGSCNELEVYVRPASMFLEDVIVDGVSVPRFKSTNRWVSK